MLEAHVTPSDTARPSMVQRILLATGILIAIITAGAMFWFTSKRPPLPDAIIGQAGFTIYYPKPFVAGSTLEKNTVELTHGVLFYKLGYGGQTIKVAEQAAPSIPPDLDNVVGFNKLSTDAGVAVIGQSPGGQSAIILNATTLITISAPKQVPNDIVAETAQNMHSLTSN